MTITALIDTLTRMVESGGYKGDDELVVTWWAYEDVILVDDNYTEDEAREVWADIHDDFDSHIDSVISTGNDILYDLVPNKEVN